MPRGAPHPCACPAGPASQPQAGPAGRAATPPLPLGPAMPHEPRPACKLVSANYRRLSAVIPSRIYVCGDHLAVYNLFVTDLQLPMEFYRDHVRRLLEPCQLFGATPNILWLCAGSEFHLDLIHHADGRGWDIRLMDVDKFDEWLLADITVLAGNRELRNG